MTNDKPTNSPKPHDLPIEDANGQDASNAHGHGAADKATSDGGAELPVENGATDGAFPEDVNSSHT